MLFSCINDGPHQDGCDCEARRDRGQTAVVNARGLITGWVKPRARVGCTLCGAEVHREPHVCQPGSIVRYRDRVTMPDAPDRAVARALARTLVDAEARRPPEGAPARAWRAALMSLEERAETTGDVVHPVQVETLRLVLSAYERSRR